MRDDGVEYFISHTEKWYSAGFIGVLFGAGLVGNCNYTGSAVNENDDGWFTKQMSSYKKNPFPLEKETSTRVRNRAVFSAPISIVYKMEISILIRKSMVPCGY